MLFGQNILDGVPACVVAAVEAPCTAIGTVTPEKPSGRTASRMVPDARYCGPAIRLSATPRS
jgi:hypothetical protein